MPLALYVVATPIGNKQDITYRAIQTLQSVDIIAAEDTRHSAPLLAHYNISTPMLAVHEHNEQHIISKLLMRLQSGQSIGLISDAGTPLISDPGYHLVTAVIKAGFAVVPIPGPSALTTALSVAGIATDHFTFMGYFPAKATQRRQLLQKIKSYSYTHIFYETPHRIANTMADMLAILEPQRRVCVARELTKTFETVKTAPLCDIHHWLMADENQRRGEFVIVVDGADKLAQESALEPQTEALIKALLVELSINKVASMVAKLTPHTKQTIYQHALTLQEKDQ